MKTRIHGLWLVLALVSVPALAAASTFTFEAADQGAVTDLAVVTAFPTTIRNTGATTDTYTVTMVKDMPAAWSCTFCQGTVCYPPFIQQISFNLAPGSETNVDVDLTPLASEGTGSVRVTVASVSQPALTATKLFRVVTAGVEVLLVDGDGGQQLENHYATALAAADVSWAHWPRDEMGALASPELAGFAGVIWYASGMAPGLDDNDRAVLAYYVQHGGTLLLAGQDLAWQACDPASPWYSAQAAAFFPVVLGANYAGPATGATEVASLPGSPMGNNFEGVLNGIGGAGNSTSPDALQATGAGVLAQTYRNGAWAAVASTWGSGRTVFCGYAVESLGTSALGRLVDSFVDWVLGRPSAVGPAVPAAVGPLAAAPNPFNPSTTLRFELAAAGPAHVEVCDLRGRVVRRLLDRVLAAGPVALPWDGRDDRGAALPSGVYLARVTAGAETSATKLVLAK